MRRGAARLAIGVAAALVALNVLVAVAEGLTGGTPGGPRSSSYATGEDGLAAYETLLARRGHPTARERRPADEALLDPRLTAVLLDPGFVPAEDVAALRRFVRAGGRLLAGGAGGDWVARVLGIGPLGYAARDARPARRLAPAPETTGVRRLALAGGVYTTPQRALPLYGDGRGAVVAVAAAGRGRVVLLADTEVLHNRRLDDADNASFGVAAAGAPGRPVLFLESYHGYGPAEGLAALPNRWWAAFAGLLAAGVVFLWSRFRRLGPPDRDDRELPPPRAAYAEALADLLGRGKEDAAAAALLRRRVTHHLERRLGPEPEGLTAERLGRLGLGREDTAALTDPAATLLDVARAAAAVERIARRIA